MLIPLVPGAEVLQKAAAALSHGVVSSFRSQLASELHIESEQRTQSGSNPRQEVLSILRHSHSANLNGVILEDCVPLKWVMIGEVLVTRSFAEENSELETIVADALMKVMKAKSVVVQDAIAGELRQPVSRLVVSSDGEIAPTETIHVENGIKYKLDVLQIMFAAGNGTERMHAGRKGALQGKCVVDMFAGIGYFSLPFAVHGGAQCVFSIEKNPISYAFLSENIHLNSVQSKVIALCGDCRAVGNEALHSADLVSMGYIPTPVKFLWRAVQFLKNEGGILLYHHTCKREEFKSSALADAREELGDQFTVELCDFRVVKSYKPHVFHAVAELKVTPTK